MTCITTNREIPVANGYSITGTYTVEEIYGDDDLEPCTGADDLTLIELNAIPLEVSILKGKSYVVHFTGDIDETNPGSRLVHLHIVKVNASGTETIIESSRRIITSDTVSEQFVLFSCKITATGNGEKIRVKGGCVGVLPLSLNFGSFKIYDVTNP